MKKILRITGLIIAVVFLFWFTAPIAFHVLNPGNILGIFICLCLIVWLGFNRKYTSLKKRLCERKTVRILWMIWDACVCCFAAYAVIVSVFMVFAAMSAPIQGSTAVVLGAQVKPWGPSVNLQQRIDGGEKYLNETPKTVAVLSGGKGSDEVKSEAQCMYDVMTKDGISPDRLYLEDKSKNTNENLIFSKRIIKQNKLNKNIAIVTDSFHQLRARLIARKQGFGNGIGAVNPVVTSNINTVTYPTFFVREWIAIPAELLR